MLWFLMSTMLLFLMSESPTPELESVTTVLLQISITTTVLVLSVVGIALVIYVVYYLQKAASNVMKRKRSVVQRRKFFEGRDNA